MILKKRERKKKEWGTRQPWCLTSIHNHSLTSCGPRGYCSPKFVSCLGLKKFVFVCLFNYFNFKKMGCIFTSCDFMDATLHVCLHFACSVMCLILLHIVHDEWNNSSFFLHVIYCWMVVLFKMLNLKICCWFFS
jgi:hypothetical protein